MVKNVVLIMVHGTWGRGFFPDSRPPSKRGLRWYEPNSYFYCSLLKYFNDRGVRAHTSFVEWSGANSFNERERAARDLAQTIDTQLACYAGLPIYLIGHSHGGNVISRSFAHTQSPLDHIRVVTLATPFLEVFKTELSNRQVQSLRTLYLVSFFVISGFLSIPVNYFFPQMLVYPPPHPVMNLVIGISMLIVMGFATTVAFKSAKTLSAERIYSHGEDLLSSECSRS
jgi:hypothetical protein